MAEERKSLTEDRDMLERYFVWRALDRQQRRQRRVRGAIVVAAAVSVIGVAAVGWSSYGAHLTASFGLTGSPSAGVARATNVEATGVARGTDNVVNSKPQAAPSPTASPLTGPGLTAPPESVRVPAASTPPVVAVGRTARANVRTPARLPTPERVRAEPSREPASPSAIPVDRAKTSDLAASAAPGDDWPASSTSDERRAQEPRVDATTPRIIPWTTSSASPVVETSRVDENPIVIPAGAVAATPTCPDMGAMMDGASPDGRTRGQRVADCVGGWVKGETREFRDGVKRGVDEFRAGVDKVGRGLQWLGDKLRRPE